MNNYIHVLDTDGKRITSIVDNMLAPIGESALLEQAKTQYPDAYEYVFGDDTMLDEFLAGKIFKDGNMIDKPPVVKSKEQILREKRAEIEQEYLPRLDAIKGGITARLAQGQDITELQNHYKTVLAEMTEKLNSVTVS